MKRYPVAVILAALFLSSPARAQDTPAPAPTASPAPKVEKTTSDFTLGLAWQGPTRLTGSATFMWGKPKMLIAWSPGKLVQVRLGDRGGQLGLGFVTGVFEEQPFKPSGIAVTLKAIALRTWRDPDETMNGNTYAGAESDIVLLGIRGSLGYAWKVAGSGAPGGRFVWSIGLGL